MSEHNGGSTAQRLVVEGLCDCSTQEIGRYADQLEGSIHPLDKEIVAAIISEKDRAPGHGRRIQFVELIHENLLQSGALESAQGRIIRERVAQLAASDVDALSMPILIRRAVREQFNRKAAHFGRKLIDDLPDMSEESAFSMFAVEIQKLRDLSTRLHALNPESALREVSA